MCRKFNILENEFIAIILTKTLRKPFLNDCEMVLKIFKSAFEFLVIKNLELNHNIKYLCVWKLDQHFFKSLKIVFPAIR